MTASRIDIRIDDARVLEAFSKAPEAMRRHVGGAVMRGAGDIVTEAQRIVPKSESALETSIKQKQIDDLTWMAVAGTAHAAMVEYGTGPAAGKKKYYPNPDNLLQYLMTNTKARGFERWSRSKKQGKDRGSQELEIWFRSRAFAWWIYQHGTKAQPFMAPAAEAKRDRCTELVRAAVSKGLLEVFGGHA